ncbi:MAG: YggS family pyridoxal phosphate-dependent enzyme [Candidatus Omnitrophota bacterium]
MIKENVSQIIKEIPINVEIEAAVKNRTPEEILEAIEAGIRIIGENYVQETKSIIKLVNRDEVRIHFIGHLQRNKVNKAVEVFDMIETVDSFKLASWIDGAAKDINKIMPVLIEINIARERQKFGVIPEDTEAVIRDISILKNIRIMGLMTMGPLVSDIEDLRPYFRNTKKLFIKIKDLNLNNVFMQYLSMGMSSSYKIAIEEGANIVRIGSYIFGARQKGNKID